MPREGAGLSREVVGVTPVTRTVEGDLGMRWSAVSTVEAAGLPQPAGPARRRRGRRAAPRPGAAAGVRWSAVPAAAAAGLPELAGPARRRRDHPGYLPAD